MFCTQWTLSGFLQNTVQLKDITPLEPTVSFLEAACRDQGTTSFTPLGPAVTERSTLNSEEFQVSVSEIETYMTGKGAALYSMFSAVGEDAGHSAATLSGRTEDEGTISLSGFLLTDAIEKENTGMAASMSTDDASACLEAEVSFSEAEKAMLTELSSGSAPNCSDSKNVLNSSVVVVGSEDLDWARQVALMTPNSWL